MARTPTVAGVAGGVGVSTVAAALRAIDGGVYAGGPVDLLVCRTTVSSLGLTHEIAARTPYPPVLAVVADIPSTIPGPVRARMRMAEPHLRRLVAVPFVPEWRSRADPYREAAHVLEPGLDIPRPLRDFARAMRRLVDALSDVVCGVVSDPSGAQPLGVWDEQAAPALLTHQTPISEGGDAPPPPAPGPYAALTP